ncbi:hypothetical protein Golob_019342, partial [Gossypium lobatum]|nr:hypothetical protein [Gossypium lobatum]
MDRDFDALSLDDEEEEVVQVQRGSSPVFKEKEFCLIGCFLTASVIHFPAIRSSMANLWHPVKGVQISNLGEKRFLFRFFHKMDLKRVLKGSPWTFNSNLMLVHHLGEREDPLKVPLIFANFWIQIHDVPPRYFFERGAKSSSYEDIDGCDASFEKEEEGYSGSFCQAKMDLGFELAKMGSNLGRSKRGEENREGLGGRIDPILGMNLEVG